MTTRFDEKIEEAKLHLTNAIEVLYECIGGKIHGYADMKEEYMDTLRDAWVNLSKLKSKL